MTRNRAFCVRLICVATLAISSITVMRAQLSAPLSPSLDSNLNGLGSDVAPIPSSELAPGANNLLTPDEHQLPYDAIGANVTATMMDPTVIQYYSLSRTPSQIDNSIRDSSYFTGQTPRTPLNLVDFLGRRTIGFLSSPQSSAATNLNTGSIASSAGVGITDSFRMRMNNTQMQGGILRLAPSMQGSAANATALTTPYSTQSPSLIAPAMPVASNTSQATTGSKKNSEKRARNSQELHSSSQDHPLDESRSPLEATDTSLSDYGSAADVSPFPDLNQMSFLNPDIMLTAQHTRSFRKDSKKARVAGKAQRTNNPLDRLNRFSIEDRTVSSTTPILDRQQDQGKKPKWHNPILQQMEDGSNP